MPKTRRLKELAAHNSKVDVLQAESALQVIRQLRAAGVEARGYNLRGPFRVRTSPPDSPRTRANRRLSARTEP